MSKKNSQIDPKRFTQLLADFSKALEIPMTAFVEQSSCRDAYYLRKDFRYKRNQTLPFFLIELYEHSTELIVDTLAGSKIYEWHDDETYEALRPVILKTLRQSFGELAGQIAHEATSGSTVIVRPSSLEQGKVLLYLQRGDTSYSAELKDGKVSLCIDASPEIVTEYVDAVMQHLVPKAQEASDA